MGTLVAWHYPTALFADQADHTYVACGNGGKAWSCWGGKTGGNPLRSAPGSTLRADAIAEPNERANIKCYLVNGVCHQAANRILLPAGITVRGVRGYWLSEALYGTYGRPRGFLGFCEAPFHQHSGISGDLPQCAEAAGGPPAPMPLAAAEAEPEPPGMASYLSQVNSLYAQAGAPGGGGAFALDAEEAGAFQLRLFGLLTDFKLGEEYRQTSGGEALMAARGDFEQRRDEVERAFFYRETGVGEFVAAYNELMIDFQRQSAEILPENGFRALLAESPETPVVLGDPEVARLAYPEA